MAAVEKIGRAPRHQEHQHADPDHDAEGEENRRDGWMVVLEPVEPWHLGRRAVAEDHRSAARDGDLVEVLARGLVRPGEQDQRNMRPGFPVRFHRGDLGRLVFERVEAVLVAGQDLQRDQHRPDADAGAQRLPHGLRTIAGQIAQRRQAGDEKRHREPRSEQHVDEPPREGGVEHDGPPVGRIGDAVAHFEAGGRVHPGIERQDPER